MLQHLQSKFYSDSNMRSAVIPRFNNFIILRFKENKRKEVYETMISVISLLVWPSWLVSKMCAAISEGHQMIATKSSLYP